jgi:hypothetical protein
VSRGILPRHRRRDKAAGGRKNGARHGGWQRIVTMDGEEARPAVP